MNDDARFHDDEIVSAVLDGEATPEERARVQGDPELSARLEVFRQLSNAVAEPVGGLDEVTRRRLVERALGATDPLPGMPGAGHQPARRNRFLGGAAAVASAAVVALLALTGGQVILEGARGGDDDMASSPVADETADMEAGEVSALISGGDDAAEGDDADYGLERFSYGVGATQWIGDHQSPADFAAAARGVATLPGSGPPTTTIPAPEQAPDAATDGDATDIRCIDELDQAAAMVEGEIGAVVGGAIDGREARGLVPVDGSRPVIIVHLDECTISIVG
jgi:hypothetical protein